MSTLHRPKDDAKIAKIQNSMQGIANATLVQYQSWRTIHAPLLRSRTSCVPSCLDVPNTMAPVANARSGLIKTYRGNANQLANGVNAIKRNATSCTPKCFEDRLAFWLSSKDERLHSSSRRRSASIRKRLVGDFDAMLCSSIHWINRFAFESRLKFCIVVDQAHEIRPNLVGDKFSNTADFVNYLVSHHCSHFLLAQAVSQAWAPTIQVYH